MTTSAEIQTKVDKTITNMERLDSIVNGTDSQTVNLDSGSTPSIRKAIKDEITVPGAEAISEFENAGSAKIVEIQEQADDAISDVTAQRVLAQSAALNAGNDADRAEAARDAAITNADVYADISTGLAAVADNEQFMVVSADGLEIIRYKRLSVSTYSEVARYVSAQGVNKRFVIESGVLRAQVTTDEAGYALEYMDLSGKRRSTSMDRAHHAGDVATEIEYSSSPQFPSAMRDENGYGFEYIDKEMRRRSPDIDRIREVAGYTPDMTRAYGDYLFAIIYGQSVFVSSGTDLLSATAHSSGALLMFNGGPTFDYSNSANMTSLVDLVEVVKERASRGVAESMLQFYNAEAGHQLYDDGTNVVVTIPAEGGKSAAELSEDGAYFFRITAAIDALAALALAAGKTVGVVPVVWCQGEQDLNLNTLPRNRYDTIEHGIRKPIEDYARSAFGYPVRIVFVLTQECSHSYYGKPEPTIALGDLDTVKADQNYVMAGPMYQYDYGDSSGVGSHLKDAVEMKWAAAMAGRAVQRVMRGVKHPIVMPLRAWRQGARAIMVEYDVPVEPLVFDEVNISNPGSYGFRLTNEETGTTITTTSANIKVVGRRCVRIILGDDLPTTKVRLTYAHIGGSTGVAAGRTTGPRGCLRDSDPAIFDPSGINKPLFNWAPVHKFIL